ncbi:MAG: ABC transporter ATP-binding protein, partial [SAR202 cluster bacterium]|nr:ABC transporter ATP-binding protein [SAR202 cluster bacterium]
MKALAEEAPAPKKRGRAALRRVATCFGPYQAQTGVVVAAVLVASLLGLVQPFLLRVIVDEGLTRGDLGLVTRFTLLTLAAVGAQMGLSLFYTYLSVVVGQRILRDLRNQLFGRLQKMSLRFFTNTRTGEIQSRLASDVGGVQGVVSETVTNTLANVTAVLSTLIAMVILDWRLTLLAVGVLPVFALIGGRVGMAVRGVQKQAQEKTAELNAITQETLSVNGALLSKTSGRPELAEERYARENESLTQVQIRRQMIGRYFFTLIGLSFSITPALVYWLAGWLIGAGDRGLTVGGIVAFTSMQARFFFPLTSLMNVQVELTSSLALFERIFEYLDLPLDIEERPDALRLNPTEVRGAVTVEEVTFRYDPAAAEPTLQGISFQAQPGELVAL